MVFFKRSFLIAIALLVMIVISSCGSSPTDTGAGAGTTPTAAAAQDTPTAAAASAIVKTASATVGGKSVTILTDAKGMTLYYFTPDTPTTTACTGGCATNWPPVVYDGSGSVPADSAATGTFTVVKTANGNQVQYNGHFLYTFIKDKAAGDTTGQGVGNKWYVATVDLTKAV